MSTSAEDHNLITQITKYIIKHYKPLLTPSSIYIMRRVISHPKTSFTKAYFAKSVLPLIAKCRDSNPLELPPAVVVIPPAAPSFLRTEVGCVVLEQPALRLLWFTRTTEWWCFLFDMLCTLGVLNGELSPLAQNAGAVTEFISQIRHGISSFAGCVLELTSEDPVVVAVDDADDAVVMAVAAVVAADGGGGGGDAELVAAAELAGRLECAAKEMFSADIKKKIRDTIRAAAASGGSGGDVLERLAPCVELIFTTAVIFHFSYPKWQSLNEIALKLCAMMFPAAAPAAPPAGPFSFKDFALQVLGEEAKTSEERKALCTAILETEFISGDWFEKTRKQELEILDAIQNKLPIEFESGVVVCNNEGGVIKIVAAEILSRLIISSSRHDAAIAALVAASMLIDSIRGVAHRAAAPPRTSWRLIDLYNFCIMPIFIMRRAVISFPQVSTTTMPLADLFELAKLGEQAAAILTRNEDAVLMSTTFAVTSRQCQQSFLGPQVIVSIAMMCASILQTSPLTVARFLIAKFSEAAVLIDRTVAAVMRIRSDDGDDGAAGGDCSEDNNEGEAGDEDASQAMTTATATAALVDDHHKHVQLSFDRIEAQLIQYRRQHSKLLSREFFRKMLFREQQSIKKKVAVVPS
jgi:hypothetical protein